MTVSNIKFADGDLLGAVHGAMARECAKDAAVCHASLDSATIDARDVPKAQRSKPPKCLDVQGGRSIAENLADLPSRCAKGAKRSPRRADVDVGRLQATYDRCGRGCLWRRGGEQRGVPAGEPRPYGEWRGWARRPAKAGHWTHGRRPRQARRAHHAGAPSIELLAPIPYDAEGMGGPARDARRTAPTATVAALGETDATKIAFP
jgi:hypothetical protein